MSKQLYICYSREDSEEISKVNTIVEELKDYIHDALIIMTEEPDFDSIDDSSAVLCVLTSSFAASVDVAKELKHSSNLNKTILGLFATSKDDLDDIFGKFRNKELKDSIRSGFFKWYPLNEQNSFVKQLVSTLGLDSPIADAVGALISLKVDCKQGFNYQIDDHHGMFPSSSSFSFRLLPGCHTITVYLPDYEYCSFKEIIEVTTGRESFERTFDLDTLFDELGYEKTIVDELGNSYTGWIIRGLFDGAGVYRTHDGFIYDGVFNEGQIVSGLLKEPNGNQYSGQFQDWKRHGEGKQIWLATGEMFEGTWEHDIMNGHGMFVSSDSSIYEGEFYDGVIKSGKVILGNGKQYQVNNKTLRLNLEGVVHIDKSFINSPLCDIGLTSSDKEVFDENPFEKVSKDNTIKSPSSSISAYCTDELRHQIYYIKGKLYKDESGSVLYSGVANYRWEDEGIILIGQVQQGVAVSGVFYMEDETPIVEGLFENNVFNPQEEHFPLWKDFLYSIFDDLNMSLSDNNPDEDFIEEPNDIALAIEEPSDVIVKEPISNPVTVTKKLEPIISSNSIKYHDGSVYYGPVQGNKRQGEGRLVFVNGNHFEGSWDNDRYNGSGCFTWSSEEIVFKGTFIDDLPIMGCYYMGEDLPIVSGQWIDQKFVPSEEFFPNWREFIEGLDFDYIK